MTQSSDLPEELPQSDDRYLPGEIIDGKYRLVRPLGAGGVGRVWVAHNLVLDVHIGLKLIYANVEGGGTQGARLLQEARAAARLGHPAIVRVYDFGETRHGDPFVAMELLYGETLGETLARERRISAIRAIQTMLPIADALGAAHSKGIVHRDVKPENIYISKDEAGRVQPKLLDFGIARVEASRKLTLQGTVLGTPDYMSPEQARGESTIDARTDIWSFCIVLYELMTGETPFRGENYNALLQSIIHDPPRPLAQLAAGDRELWRLLELGMCKDPKQRWDSIRMLGEALALWLYERGVREDVCAASLKTSWLDSGLSEVTIHTSPTEPPETKLPEREPMGGVVASRRSTLEEPLPEAPRRRTARNLALAAIALGAIGAATFAYGAGPAVSISQSPAPPAEPAAAKPAVPVAVTPVETPASPPLEVDADATPAPKPSSAPARPKVTATPAPAKRPALEKRGKEYDFGF